MKHTPEKLDQARKRAACVYELREWRRRSYRSRPKLGQFVQELKASFPGLSMSQRSLYRWAELAGDPIDPLRLIDTRGGFRVHAKTLDHAATARQWWFDRGSNILPTPAETGQIAELVADPENRRIAQHRVRVARLVMDLQKLPDFTFYIAARHLLELLHQVEPVARVSRTSAVAWARLYRQQGAAALARIRFRRPGSWPESGP